MTEYASKEALINEIKRTSKLFIKEFQDVAATDKDLRMDGVDRTPSEIISYQLGWMELLRGWDSAEMAGDEVITPATGYKWNGLGKLYEEFYKKYSNHSLYELQLLYSDAVDSLIIWIDSFEDDELFKSGGRKWAQSIPSDWPVWKWVHINTVAPFKSFRSKIRKWKKLRIMV